MPGPGIPDEPPVPVRRVGTSQPGAPNAGRPGASPASAGAPTPARRGKKSDGAAAAGFDIPWRGVFPVIASEQGYDGGELPVAESLRPGKGAWPRDDVPSVVLVHDPGNREHADALRRLESDDRFRIASHLFNCYRIDARGLRAPPPGLRLAVHGTGGDPVGETGSDKLLQVLDLMESAWRAHTGRDLSRSLADVDTVLRGIAACRNGIALLEAGILCDACGRRHDEVFPKIEAWRAAESRHREALDRWRARP